MKKSPFIVLLFLAIGWFTSCEKDVFDVSPTMEAYYVESVGLPSVSVDSVKSFSSKVKGFTQSYPEAKEHAKYPLIKENIRLASVRIIITIDTAWAGSDTIHY